METHQLRVPYGQHATGRLVAAGDAVPGVGYLCPNCAEPLVLRAGEKRVRHFAHQHAECAPESLLHKTAKKLAAQVLNDVAAGRGALTILGKCRHCRGEVDFEIPRTALDAVSIEHPVDRFVCDVVALREAAPALAVEIVVTHRNEAEKAEALAVPWLEVRAEDVIGDPTRWSPIASKLKPATCDACRQRMTEIIEIADRHGVPRDLYAPRYQTDDRPFVAELETCFRCRKDTPVFWWDGVPFAETAPPWPMPANIKRRYSKTYGGKYWANTCFHCGALQGDNFLFLFENGVLSHLPIDAKVQKQLNKQAVERFTKKMLGGLTD